MAVDDLWYLSKRGPNGERVKSKRYGRGKRWRCRYEDATGHTRTRFFERKADADAWDKKASNGTAEETQTDQGERRTTFHDYAERWRLSRQIGQALDYRRHTESRYATTTIRTSATGRSALSTSRTFWSGSPSY
ncbi:hypothetical protein [Plantactinospora sonchi]|uniref:AP2-like integrase N-terminal domain-containing protein n=1 Tax=Plantactinospora sonchi TaxID=1544735 RepID=A0ABU7RTC8_9ACTN